MTLFAGEAVYSAAFDEVGMRIPPYHATAIRTELPGPEATLGYEASTVKAGSRGCKIRISQMMPPTVGFDSVKRDIERS